MLLNCGAGEVLRVPWTQEDSTSQSSRKSVLNIHWKDWCWSWSFNTLATWWEELTHWKRPWCWERLKAGGERDERMRWLDGITNLMDMSLSKLRELVMGQRSLVCCSPWGHKDWTIELNWTELVTSFNNCYWTQVQQFTTWKPIFERQVLVRKESLLYSGVQQPREKVDSYLRTNSKILFNHESF